MHGRSTFESRRRVSHSARRCEGRYGAGYDFDASVLRPALLLPAFLHSLRARVAERLGMQAEVLAHALVTEYRPVTQLGWHRDVPDFEAVVGISLGTACRMLFRPYRSQRGQRVFTLELAPRARMST